VLIPQGFAERVHSNQSGLEMCVPGIQHALACLMREDVVKAYQYLESNQQIGKVVLTVGA
jgi:hypothetical protein